MGSTIVLTLTLSQNWHYELSQHLAFPKVDGLGDNDILAAVKPFEGEGELFPNELLTALVTTVCEQKNFV